MRLWQRFSALESRQRRADAPSHFSLDMQVRSLCVPKEPRSKALQDHLASCTSLWHVKCMRTLCVCVARGALGWCFSMFNSFATNYIQFKLLLHIFQKKYHQFFLINFPSSGQPLLSFLLFFVVVNQPAEAGQSSSTVC